jgi:hypothetical protein
MHVAEQFSISILRILQTQVHSESHKALSHDNVLLVHSSVWCFCISTNTKSGPDKVFLPQNNVDILSLHNFQLEFCQFVIHLDGHVCWSGMRHSQVQLSYFFLLYLVLPFLLD